MRSGSPNIPEFPPSTPGELERAGWERPDVVLISGDAYVDHPSFGAAVIARVLSGAGYRVAVLPQPDWRSVHAFRELGEPRLFFAVTGGNVDSMVANYTPFRNQRKSDAYSPDGKRDMRPNRAVIVYAQRARVAFPGVPIVLGGVEASMRRLSHYDFWEDKVRRSILLDAKADLLLYGMAEEAVLDTARLLDQGKPLEGIRGAVYATGDSKLKCDRLPDFDDVVDDPLAFTKSFRMRHDAADPFKHKTLAEPYGKRLVVQTPAPMPIPEKVLDEIYELPFTGKAHPRYGKREIPALKTVETSLVTHRGCFGGCTFCGIAFHQGRLIQSRSRTSVMREARRLAKSKRFRGTINDVGGPTANMYGFSCRAAESGKECRRPHCLLPKPCRHLADGHSDAIKLLKSISSIEEVKHAFVQSGVRHDLAMTEQGQCYLEELVKHHISGTLKVAPEHSEASVLKAMGKPPFEDYVKFRKLFDKLNRKHGKRQFLVSYFISAHPGSGMPEAKALRKKLDSLGLKPEQIQDYTPQPGTAASVMFHTGLYPFTDEPLHVARTDKDRRAQRRVIQD